MSRAEFTGTDCGTRAFQLRLQSTSKPIGTLLSLTMLYCRQLLRPRPGRLDEGNHTNHSSSPTTSRCDIGRYQSAVLDCQVNQEYYDSFICHATLILSLPSIFDMRIQFQSETLQRGQFSTWRSHLQFLYEEQAYFIWVMKQDYYSKCFTSQMVFQK